MEKEIYLQGSSEFLFPLQPSGIFCIVLVSFDLWHWCLEFTWLIPAPVKRGNTETFFFYSFIADAAFLYLWAKLGDRRDHPDDIYILPLKIRRYKINGTIWIIQLIHIIVLLWQILLFEQTIETNIQWKRLVM